MVARLLCRVVPFAAILLAAAGVQAQEMAPPCQPPVTDGSWCVGEQVPGEPWIWFRADALISTRGGMWGGTRTILDGHDATTFDDLRGFDQRAGYRLQGAVRVGNWILEGVYSDWGGWNSSLTGWIDGVAFNDGINGEWLGRNAINPLTLFAPMYYAATLTVPVDTAADQSGLGPCDAFTADNRPLLTARYHSEFSMVEANVKGAEPVFVFGNVRLGAGYVHARFDEIAQVALSGTFRAYNPTDPTVSLPHAALTAAAGGDLDYISGGTSGFSDGTDGSGIPSELVFAHQATTRNRFNGAQIVLDGTLWTWGRLDVGGKLQAGIYENAARGAVVETYAETNRDYSVYGRTLQGSRNQVAFLGGVSLDLGYRLTQSIVVRGGYEVLFLSGLALAQDQAYGINGGVYEVQTDGSVLLHSARIGLECAF